MKAEAKEKIVGIFESVANICTSDLIEHFSGKGKISNEELIQHFTPLHFMLHGIHIATLCIEEAEENEANDCVEINERLCNLFNAQFMRAVSEISEEGDATETGDLHEGAEA